MRVAMMIVKVFQTKKHFRTLW